MIVYKDLMDHLVIQSTELTFEDRLKTWQIDVDDFAQFAIDGVVNMYPEYCDFRNPRFAKTLTEMFTTAFIIGFSLGIKYDVYL